MGYVYVVMDRDAGPLDAFETAYEAGRAIADLAFKDRDRLPALSIEAVETDGCECRGNVLRVTLNGLEPQRPRLAPRRRR